MINAYPISNFKISPENIINEPCYCSIAELFCSYDKVIIDMSKIDDCSVFMLKLFREYKNRIILVNTDSKILSLIYLAGYDKYLTIFEDDVALEDNNRILVNRRFSIV